MTIVQIDPFTKMMFTITELLDSAVFPDAKRTQKLYQKNVKFINYTFVCGVIGILVNQLVLLTLARYLPLYLANFIAIGMAMINNYSFTVGPFGYLFGLSEKPKPKEKLT